MPTQHPDRLRLFRLWTTWLRRGALRLPTVRQRAHRTAPIDPQRHVANTFSSRRVWRARTLLAHTSRFAASWKLHVRRSRSPGVPRTRSSLTPIRGLAYFADLFGNRVQNYVKRVLGSRRPRKVIVCMYYYLDVHGRGSWADCFLQCMCYDVNPARLQVQPRIPSTR